MRSFFLLAALILVFQSTAARAAEVIAPPEALAPVRELVVQAVEQHMAPAVAVAVINKGEVVWLEAFGEADVAGKVAATVDTPFPLASCTKALTAVAFLQLRERGLVDLDKPVNAYLGEGTLRAATGKAEEITVRRLLSHTAGFARYMSYYYAPVAPAAAGDVLARYGQAVLAPGAALEYTNLGYVAAGAVLQKAADAPWGKFLESNLFAALGMTHSGASAVPTGAVTLYARDAAERLQPVPPAATDHPAGSDAWASIGDAAQFLRMVLGYGTVGEQAVLKEESVAEMFRAPKEVPEAGLGWYLGDFHTQKSFSHAGSMPGAMAELRGFPQEKTGVVVLTNADGHTLTGEITWAVASALYPDAEDKEPEPREAPATDLEAFVGDWSATLGHFSGAVALTLQIEDEDTAYLRFDEGPMRRVQGFGLLGEQVSGQLTAAFPSREDWHAPVRIALALRKSGKQLTGTFSTVSDGLFVLPTYVSFTAVEAAAAAGETP